MEQKIFPTWGYKADGSAQIFDLKEEDGDLPEGWSRVPDPRHHPNSKHLFKAAIDDWLDKPQEAEPKKRGPGRPRSPESTGL